MRKLMLAIAVVAALGGPTITPADAFMHPHGVHGMVVHHPGCWDRPWCHHGIRHHRVCVAWEVFGGERHCVRWRYYH